MNESPDPTHDGETNETDETDEAVSSGAERVIYRDAEEFRNALDKAAESIRKASGPEVLGYVIWWGLITSLVFVYTAHWTIGQNIRDNLVPGLDLTKPIWILLIGIFGLHLLELRNSHGRILRRRLCLKCGTPLLAVPVDDQGDGACPGCARPFNLGEYRRPEENRGRQFRGYIDAAHFDKAIYDAAEQINKTRAVRFEADLQTWLWAALGVAFGVMVIFGWDLFDWMPRWLPWSGSFYSIWFVVLLVWGFWYVARVKKLKPAIIAQRLCMNCGYCLLNAPTNDDGLGQCPECGEEYAEAQYTPISDET